MTKAPLEVQTRTTNDAFGSLLPPLQDGWGRSGRLRARA